MFIKSTNPDCRSPWFARLYAHVSAMEIDTNGHRFVSTLYAVYDEKRIAKFLRLPQLWLISNRIGQFFRQFFSRRFWGKSLPHKLLKPFHSHFLSISITRPKPNL